MSEFFIYFQFFFGFVLLVKGADILVNGAAALAKRIKVSDMIVGLTVVSFGTSAPELAVNLIASFNASSDLALGNIIGSNIANILLILGISSLLAPLPVSIRTVWQEIPMNLLSVIVFSILVNDQFLDPVSRCSTGGKGTFACNFLGRGDAIILLIFFGFFLYYIFHRVRSEPKEEASSGIPLGKSLVFVSLGLLGLLLGGDWIVKGAVHISKVIGLSEALIGIIIVGVGTSLPEVAASAVAAYRGRSDIAIGNALGSNLFNVLWVLGLSALLRPLSYDVSLNLDVAMMLFAVLLLYLSVFVGKVYQLNLMKGILFLTVYAGYIVFLIKFR